MLDLHARKNIRLQGYDYSQNGAYFITVCIKDRHNLLWEANDVHRVSIVGANIVRPPSPANQSTKLSLIGNIVNNAIENIPEIYMNVRINKYIIMPNHIHMILCVNESRAIGEQCSPLRIDDIAHKHIVRPENNPTVSRLIKHFKGFVTKQVGYSIWQKSFHDHIIRNEKEYLDIWQYIDENMINWKDDCYFER